MSRFRAPRRLRHRAFGFALDQTGVPQPVVRGAGVGVVAGLDPRDRGTRLDGDVGLIEVVSCPQYARLRLRRPAAPRPAEPGRARRQATERQGKVISSRTPPFPSRKLLRRRLQPSASRFYFSTMSTIFGDGPERGGWSSPWSSRRGAVTLFGL